MAPSRSRHESYRQQESFALIPAANTCHQGHHSFECTDPFVRRSVVIGSFRRPCICAAWNAFVTGPATGLVELPLYFVVKNSNHWIVRVMGFCLASTTREVSFDAHFTSITT